MVDTETEPTFGEWKERALRAEATLASVLARGQMTAGDYALSSDGHEAFRAVARLAPPRGLLVLIACDVAEHALEYVPSSEIRPQHAIKTARAWAHGEATTEEVRAAIRPALDASQAVYSAPLAPAASDAAHAACHVASCVDAASPAYGVLVVCAVATADAVAASHFIRVADDAFHAAVAARAKSLARSANIVRQHVSPKEYARLVEAERFRVGE